MGSTGSGRFTDYSSSPNRQDGKGGSSGGSSGKDRCREAFSTSLEDVAQYDFFTTHGTLPVAGTALRIELRGRLVAVDEHGVSVGAIPTRFNYLAGCINEGIEYSGVVSISSTSPIPRIDADFGPSD